MLQRSVAHYKSHCMHEPRLAAHPSSEGGWASNPLIPYPVILSVARLPGGQVAGYLHKSRYADILSQPMTGVEIRRRQRHLNLAVRNAIHTFSEAQLSLAMCYWS